MADYYGTILCKHPFAVENPDKFEKILRKYGLEEESEGAPGDGLWFDRDGDKFSIYGFGSFNFYDDKIEDYIEPDEIIQPFLKRGETAVFIEVGNTKCRYDESNGYAWVITKKKVYFTNLRDWVEDKIKEARINEFHPKIS